VDVVALSMVYTFLDFIPDDEIVERHYSYAIFAFPSCSTPPTQYKRDDMELKERKKSKSYKGSKSQLHPSSAVGFGVSLRD
jgi:hypothetical protein